MSDGANVGCRDVCGGKDDDCKECREEDTVGDVKVVVGDCVAVGATDVEEGTCNCGRVTFSDKFGIVSLMRPTVVGLLRRMVDVSCATGASVVES